MSDSREMFDPYWEWLEIPPEDQPPTYYRLLGLEDFEDDLATIDDAAKQKTAYLHPMASGPNRESVQKLLSEVAKARRTLLGSEAKAAYDESLRADESTSAFPPVSAPPVEQDTVTISKPPTSGSEEEETEKPEASSRSRKKSLLNDWRVHVASVSVLLVGSVSFVYYNNTKARRVAAVAAPVPDARQAKSGKVKPSEPASKQFASGKEKRSAGDRVMRRVPSKPKTRSAGKSALELMLAQDGLSMDLGKGPANAMPPGGSRGKGPRGQKQDAKDGLQAVDIDLPENWLADLKSIDDPKFVPRPKNPLVKTAPLGKKLNPGETIAVRTPLGAYSTKVNSFRLVVGGQNGLLVAVQPQASNVVVKINDEVAGKIAAAKGKAVVLAVTRDIKDNKRFRWILKCQEKAIAGRGIFAWKKTDIRFDAMLKESKPEDLVFIEEVWLGKLKESVSFGETQ